MKLHRPNSEGLAACGRNLVFWPKKVASKEGEIDCEECLKPKIIRN